MTLGALVARVLVRALTVWGLFKGGGLPPCRWHNALRAQSQLYYAPERAKIKALALRR